MAREKLRKSTMILGCILALAIVFSQYVAPQCNSAEKVKTEQSDKKTGESSTVISLPSFSLPAPVSVQANLDAYCLFEIFFEEDMDENYVEEEISYANRFFETMFQVIISPNAP